ncbi:MAG: methionine--tRNA ligase [Candidatus Wallbacteria bacterium]|nr:methionine--tRNA ligase [Candidatus Wallbacteria bacterium]
MSRDAFYITTAIDYVNAEPHMGHAYEKVGADAMARYQRLRGRRVRYTIGTDEHGQKVAESAAARGLSPQAHVDSIAGRFQEAWRQLEISNDDFIRTTEKRHHASVAELFRRVQLAGDLYLGDYVGWYCKSDETFWPEGKLVEGNCPTCNRPVQKITERNWFFKLSRYTEPLKRHFEVNPEFVLPVGRRQEMLNILEEGLEDLSISRSTFDWGIPFPGAPGHVVYVWFDALINYITSVGFPADEASFGTFWPADYHVIGKDIAKFHTIIWPAMLLAAGLPLPRHVFIHGFVMTPTGKMSKSVGNVIAPGEMAGKYGADALRYTLLREIAWGQDGVISEEILVNRYNRDLANDLGNLLHRIATIVEKHFGGVLPPVSEADAGPLEAELRAAARKAATDAAAGYDVFSFHQALEGAWGLVRAANQYVDRTEPWKWAAGKAGDGKKDALAPDAPTARRRLGTILTLGADALRQAATMLFPVIPGTCQRIRDALGAAGPVVWDSEGLLAGSLAGCRVVRGEPLFPRIEPQSKAEVAVPVKPAAAAKSASARAALAAPPAELAYDDFMKADLRVAKVLEASRVPNADKLLQLKLSLGDGQERQVVAGIAQSYAPEALVGLQVVLVANLKPAKIRGIESHGMILAATDGDGKHRVVTPDGPAPAGGRVK